MFIPQPTMHISPFPSGPAQRPPPGSLTCCILLQCVMSQLPPLHPAYVLPYLGVSCPLGPSSDPVDNKLFKEHDWFILTFFPLHALNTRTGHRRFLIRISRSNFPQETRSIYCTRKRLFPSLAGRRRGEGKKGGAHTRMK